MRVASSLYSSIPSAVSGSAADDTTDDLASLFDVADMADDAQTSDASSSSDASASSTATSSSLQSQLAAISLAQANAQASYTGPMRSFLWDLTPTDIKMVEDVSGGTYDGTFIVGGNQDVASALVGSLTTLRTVGKPVWGNIAPETGRITASDLLDYINGVGGSAHGLNFTAAEQPLSDYLNQQTKNAA